MRKFHIAIGVKDIEKSIEDYSIRLRTKPTIHVEGEYALFRTDSLNMSIRKVDRVKTGVRHIGWEDGSAIGFSEEKDCNGIIWELFNKEAQEDEISRLWDIS
ncbi:hypothetical protein HOG98_06955 [bacterium]|jgi:hypothetical protein|nr:hypothetical protein [bacterium]